MMYTITEERANELMANELELRCELSRICVDRVSGINKDSERDLLETLESIRARHESEGIFQTLLMARDISARIRERGERRTRVLLAVTALAILADDFIRGIEREA